MSRLPRPPNPLLAGAMAAVAAAAAYLATRSAPALPLDDAYIHLTFARNLASGHGFAFNPGQPSLGFTSPLWVFILALTDGVGLDPVSGARLLGILGLAAAVAVFSRLARESLPPGRTAAGISGSAALAVALSGNLAWLCASGMETALYLSLSLLAIYLLRLKGPQPLVGGLVLGLAVLARPTGMLLAIILAAALALANKRREAATAAAAAAVVAGPWFIYSVATTGFLLPPTRAGKLASNLANSGLSIEGAARFIGRHLAYCWQVDLDLLLLFLLAGGLGLGLLGQRIRTPRRARIFPAIPAPASPLALLGVWAGLDLLMHAFFFRSTAFTTPAHYLRYSVMLIPAAAGLAALATARVAERAPARFQPLLAGLLLVPALLAGTRLPSWSRLYHAHAGQLAGEHRVAADWVRQNLPADARIACLDIGILGFYSGRHVIDLGGLTDPAILPLLSKGDVGPYLVGQDATHYLELVRHDSEPLLGVRAADGKLYQLRPLRSFSYPAYGAPLLLHSLGMNLYEVRPVSAPG